MSAKAPHRRQPRSVGMNDEEHRQYLNMGGSRWFQAILAREWAAAPESVRNWPHPAPKEPHGKE